jgi:hypothetical protein
MLKVACDPDLSAFDSCNLKLSVIVVSCDIVLVRNSWIEISGFEFCVFCIANASVLEFCICELVAREL